LNESLRFFGELVLPEELVNAMRLKDWLITYCRKNAVTSVPRREMQQFVTPVHLRIKDKLTVALRELEDANHVREVAEGKRKTIHLNPALLKTGGV